MEDDSQLQRRIELSNHEDLAYLIANVRDAATARLNEALPPDGEDEDAFRIEVEALVNDYINQTFTLAAPNISINGLDVNPKEFLRSNPKSSNNESYQPFDSQKRKQVADLITQEEKLLEEVAALKRTKPAEAAAEQAQRINATTERDDELFQKRVEKDSVIPEIQLDIPPLERQEGVETQFKTAIEALERLKKDMPSVVAKMERAKVAGNYVLEDS